MINIKSKKAVSHIEIIISFLIFVSIITFLLVVFRPLTVFSKTTSSDLDITESQILDYISTKLEVQSVKIPSGVNGSCISIDKTETAVEENIVVKNDVDERIDAKTELVGLIKFKKSGEFYQISSSDEFVESDSSLVTCATPTDYTLGVAKTYNKVSNTSLHNLFNDYNASYQTTKELIGLNNDFNIILRNSQEEELLKGEVYKPLGIEIQARDVAIEILDSRGEIQTGILNIQVWS